MKSRSLLRRKSRLPVLALVLTAILVAAGGFIRAAEGDSFSPDSGEARRLFAEAMGLAGREVTWVQGNTIGSLRLSAGTESELYTFRRTMDLTGTVSSRATVRIGVFSFLDGRLSMWSLKSVGPGNLLFQEKPDLVWEGANYIVIVTEEAGRLFGSVLSANRMPEKLEDELSGLTVNLYEVFGP